MERRIISIELPELYTSKEELVEVFEIAMAKLIDTYYNRICLELIRIEELIKVRIDKLINASIEEDINK